MQGIMGLSAGSKQEVCSLQAIIEPQGQEARQTRVLQTLWVCGLCFEPTAAC